MDKIEQIRARHEIVDSDKNSHFSEWNTQAHLDRADLLEELENKEYLLDLFRETLKQIGEKLSLG